MDRGKIATSMESKEQIEVVNEDLNEVREQDREQEKKERRKRKRIRMHPVVFPIFEPPPGLHDGLVMCIRL